MPYSVTSSVASVPQKIGRHGQVIHEVISRDVRRLGNIWASVNEAMMAANPIFIRIIYFTDRKIRAHHLLPRKCQIPPNRAPIGLFREVSGCGPTYAGTTSGGRIRPLRTGERRTPGQFARWFHPDSTKCRCLRTSGARPTGSASPSIQSKLLLR